MRLTSLELENIKSYAGPLQIDFSPGLNAVFGHNGSGKSTVLEAIGYVLFDYLPYGQAAFVREGARAGTIRVRLLADDGREYEVVRRIGTGSTYYVVDVETNTRLAERADNVLDWVATQAFQIDGPVDLKALFKNAVGVPQGLMTADFLNSARTRESIFNPLLRVEEYREAYTNLRETASYLKDVAGTVSNEIARLEGETARYDELVGLLDERQRSLAESARRLAQLNDHARSVEADRSALDAIEAELFALRETLRGAEYEANLCRERRQEAEKDLDSARRAQHATAETEPGYHLHLEAESRLSRLDEQRIERDGLNATLANVAGLIDATRRHIESLEREMKTAASDAAAAASLASEVDRCRTLEHDLLRARGRLKERPTLEQGRERALARLARDEENVANVRRRINAADASAALAQTLPMVREELRTLTTELGRLDGLAQQQSCIEAEGRALRERHDAAVAAATRYAEIEQRIATLESESRDLPSIEAEYQVQRDQRTSLRATIEYQTVARRELATRRCPLLDLECPVVRADGTAVGRFDDLRADLEERLRHLTPAMALLEREIEISKLHASELQTLRVDAAGLAGSRNQLQELEFQLAGVRSQFKDLRDQLAQRHELEVRQAELQVQERAAQGAADELKAIPELQQRYRDIEMALADVRVEATEIEKQLQALDALAVHAEAVQVELDSMGDVIQRQQRLLASAARQPALAAQWEDERRRVDDKQIEFDDLKERLQQFETLDDELRQQREVRDIHRPAYEAYLTNREEAARLEERQVALTSAEHALTQAGTAYAEAQRQLDGRASQYDAARHNELREEAVVVARDLAQQGTKHDRLQADVREAEGDVSILKRKRERLGAQQRELDELSRVVSAVHFVRETIKAAGPAVTESLLTNISLGANDIFAEIMDDHAVELRWDRDYEVLVQRGPEVRKFAQLSGGEQMSAALAVRLSLLREMSDVDFAFFDEPTQNMDAERRANLADQIRAVKGFEQLLVISHDDTFEHHTDNLIRLRKVAEQTEVEAG